MAIDKAPSKQALLDRATVKEVLNGNPESFQKLMDRYYDIIYYTILKMVYSKKEAEELTLDVFSKAYQNLNTYSEKYAFSTWLFNIATHRGIDHIRRKKANIVSIVEDNKEEAESSVVLSSETKQHPDEILIKQQLSGELHSLVEELKPLWKELINMRYFKELSYEEIAAQLDMPMGTIKNQLYRAKQKLYKMAVEKRFEE